MVLPEEGREAVWKDALVPYQEVELEDSPFWTLGFHWHRPSWLAEWSVMNLLPDGAEAIPERCFSPLCRRTTPMASCTSRWRYGPTGTSGQWSRWGI